MRKLRSCCLLAPLIISLCRFGNSQVPNIVAQAAPPNEQNELKDPGIPKQWCPGEFPTDLTIHNCVYRQRQRVEDWITGSVTDQAVTTSALSALFSSAIRSPSEWPGTAYGFSLRLRASYIGGLANGTTQFVIASAFHLDQSHISCAEDPINQARINDARASDSRSVCEGRFSFFARSSHIVLDTVTARVSKPQPVEGPRVPSPRLFGAVAGAYGQSPFEPAGENTITAILTRSGMSLVTPLIGSILHEYSSLLGIVTKPFHPSKKLPATIESIDLKTLSPESPR
jgi:hypothetical protein